MGSDSILNHFDSIGICVNKDLNTSTSVMIVRKRDDEVLQVLQRCKPFSGR
jgi:hypothetical protein